jgi:hypothetical protein
MPRKLPQLCPRAVERPRLVDRAPVQVRHLVRPDDPGFGILSSAGVRLEAREAHGGFPGGLAPQRALIDVRRPDLEVQPQPSQ